MIDVGARYQYHTITLDTRTPGDTESLDKFLSLRIESVEPIAMLVKTEGNGCVNDFTRTMAYESYKTFFLRRNFLDVGIVVSGGTEGVLSPHATLFYKTIDRVAHSSGPAFSIGTSRTRELAPHEIGTALHADLVSVAVAEAMKAGLLGNADEVKYVQIKCPLLRDEDIEVAAHTGKSVVVNDTYRSMAFSRGASALGAALALGEISALSDSDICTDWNLYSSVTSVSSGAELRHCEVIVMGNSPRVGGNLFMASTIMRDPIDVTGVGEVMKSYVSSHSERSVRQLFAKADPVGMVRGNRSIMLDDSDIHATRHARAAVGAVLSCVVGRTNIYVSGGAEHQGPRGGGPVAIIVENVLKQDSQV